MSEHKWTPGPWHAGRFSSVVGCPVVAQPDPKQNSIVVAGTRSAAALEVGAFKAEVIANAHLIAAAPDLYEALEAMRDHAASRPQKIDDLSADRVFKQAEDALAKAKGTEEE